MVAVVRLVADDALRGLLGQHEVEQALDQAALVRAGRARVGRHRQVAFDDSVRLADNPGRHEPGTGEINFKNVFKYIYSRNYQGVLCMEHGISNKTKEGELSAIKAYRDCDNFLE